MVSVFEKEAQQYDAWFDRNRAVYHSEIRALQRFLSSPVGGLEIGVGTGRFAIPLGLRVGVEPAGAMAEIAARRGLKVVRAVAEALPFRKAAFPLALMVTTLCFLQDPFRALEEAARVLQPGGRLLIGMIDRDSPLGRRYEARQAESIFYREARFYGVREVLAWLTELPFRNPQTCQTLLGEVDGLTAPEPAQDGHGAGGFAVIAAQRS